MARSTDLVGRIIRNIKKYDKVFSASNVTQIYDELNEAQKDLFARVIVEKSFDLIVLTDQENYILSDLDTAGDIIRDIYAFIKPDEWFAEIIYIPRDEWDSIRKSSIVSTQPLFFTVFEKTLKLYPTNQADGETLKLWAHLKQPTTLISNETEPELSAIWDKALEYFTTAQFLTAKMEQYYLSKYYDEIDEKGATEFITQTNSQVGEIE